MLSVGIILASVASIVGIWLLVRDRTPQLLPHVVHDDEHINAETKAAFSECAFLISGLKVEYLWWEVTVLTRKCLIVAAQTLIPPSLEDGTLHVLLLATAITSMCIHFSTMPYNDDILNRLEAAGLMANGMTLLCAEYVMFSADAGWGKTIATLIAFVVNATIQIWFLVLWGVHAKKACVEADLLPADTKDAPEVSTTSEVELAANPLSEHGAHSTERTIRI